MIYNLNDKYNIIERLHNIKNKVKVKRVKTFLIWNLNVRLNETG